ncbi:MAG TPA: hypothetical protein VFS36_13955 [Chitinophagaceae bacterium]|nr:hypothetical protein [Chitinophagaceae bacterium]
MDKQVAVRSLHLEYRLWIAELNFDINLLRIFNDRLKELATISKNDVASSSRINEFGTKFNACRDTIDELRHRLHIEKMNLAAAARDNKAADATIPQPIDYAQLRDDFFAFRVTFKEVKTDFLRFEGQQS